MPELAEQALTLTPESVEVTRVWMEQMTIFARTSAKDIANNNAALWAMGVVLAFTFLMLFFVIYRVIRVEDKLTNLCNDLTDARVHGRWPSVDAGRLRR